VQMTVINDYEYKGQIIELEIGDTVRLGERTDSNGQYPGWIHCRSDRTGKTGWVAIVVLEMQENTAMVKERYTSEEMTVIAGDIVETIYGMGGWWWCKRLSDSKEAWIDKSNLHKRSYFGKR